MIRNQVVDPLFPKCPIRNVLSRIGDRWSLLVLLTLLDNEHPMRFRDLCKAIPDVSQKMLTSTLRELEADDLVKRTAYPEVPSRVEYELTERGQSLIPLLIIGEHGSHCQAQKGIFIVNKKLENVRFGEVMAQIDEKSRHHLNFSQMIPAQRNRILLMLCYQNLS